MVIWVHLSSVVIDISLFGHISGGKPSNNFSRSNNIKKIRNDLEVLLSTSYDEKATGALSFKGKFLRRGHKNFNMEKYNITYSD